MDWKVSWSELWKTEPHQLLIQSVYDVFTSPYDPFSWGLTENWFNDQVLGGNAEVISTGISPVGKNNQQTLHYFCQGQGKALTVPKLTRGDPEDPDRDC